MGLLFAMLSCTSLATRYRTSCSVEGLPTIAIVSIYESEIFNVDSPSGFPNEDLSRLSDELVRLGFNPVNIDPLLNDEIRYCIESTIRHEKRIDLISSILEGNYDYFMYISLKNKYVTSVDDDEYTVYATSRLRLLNADIIDDAEETQLDEMELYDMYKADRKREEGGSLTRESLKDKSLNIYWEFLLNFVNEYVKKIRNYQYARAGEEPICFNLDRDAIKLVL